MARALILLALCSSAACFHAAPYSASSTQAKWRAMRTSTGANANRPDAPTPGEVLSVEQTYELALANSAEVSALQAESEAIAAEAGVAKQLENPQLRFTNFDVNDALAQRGSMNIGLRVPIPRPGSRRAGAESAKQLAQSTQSEAEDEKRLLRAQVYKLYARLAMLSADLEHTARAVELLGQRRDQIAARAEQAVAMKLDVAMADVQHAEAQADHAEVRDQITQVERELTRLAGIPAGVRFAAGSEQLQLVDQELDRDRLTDQAMAARPALRGAHANRVAAEADVYLARGRAYPWFDWAQLQYRVSRDASPSAFGFGIALTLPIFSWNRGEVRAMRAVVHQRDVEERSIIASVAAEVDLAVGEVERTAKRAHQLEHELLPQAEAAAREAEAALASGAIDPVVASEIDEKVVDARRLHLEALLEHREAVIDLEMAVGGPLAVADEPKRKPKPKP